MNGSGNERMALHQDQWPLVPHPMDFPFMANVMYLISDNSPENGGTRLISRLSQMATPRLQNRQQRGDTTTGGFTYSAKGIGHCLGRKMRYGNGLNRSGSIRSNISTAFLQPWVKPQENHPYSLRDEVLEKMTDKQKKILGFSHFGTLGGHDGSSVSAADFDPKKQSIGILRP